MVLKTLSRAVGFGLFAAITLVLAGCGGGGGGGSSAPAPSTPPALAAVTAQSIPALPGNNAAVLSCPTTSNYSVGSPPPDVPGRISGRVSFDRVPFFPPPNDPFEPGMGLDYASQYVAPARGVIVEALTASTANGCAGSVVASALTDGDGWYELAPGAGSVCIRARAQLYRAADNVSARNWNIVVADNTDADNLYRLDESSAASTTARPRRDLHATSGWGNGAYEGVRAAAPFAILDTACSAINPVIAAVPDAQFGRLTYFWSARNTSDSNGTLAEGKIGGPFFSPSAVAIYLRGDAAVDTDEFDEMVIAHEFAHFVVHVVSRSDSLGGEHSLLDNLDPRVAFDEGWATAFAGLVLNTPYYRDSNQLTSSSSFSREFIFDIQRRYGPVPTGWYAEASIQRALFNISGLGVGIEGLLRTFSGVYKTSPALASIFSYISQLKSDQDTATASAIAQIVNDEAINGDTIQPFAETETNAAHPEDLPMYADVSTASGPVTVCSGDAYGVNNTLSNRRYLRFNSNISGNYRFKVQPGDAYAEAVAGFELISRGRTLTYVEAQAGSAIDRTVIYTTTAPLAIGTYVLSAFHLGNVVKDSPLVSGHKCFKVTVESVI